MKKNKKESKQALIALLLIFLMGGSTVAFSFINTLRGGQKRVPLPKDVVLERELSKEEELAILQTYRTIIKFTYKKDCVKCLDWKNVLENVVKKSNGQVYLVELEGNVTRIDIYNALRSTTLTNPKDETEIKKEVCTILVDPPDWCLAYLV
ncbi:MAG: hypothetical protein J7K98_03085 [Candidatus Aenigmarchaeota archaeon]|nr:hypothetical protein [Candidatus Aenigmarchaeota archaeon]